VNRFEGGNGYCGIDAGFSIASICIHRGEEPVISGFRGICNIFFTNCNLQCVYCQNHQISNTGISRNSSRMDPEEIARQVIVFLEKGIRLVGFVSPSHFIPQMKVIIDAVTKEGYKPVWVYNSNGYDKVDTLKTLEGLIDVYLPDFKYMDPGLSLSLSGAADYPSVAAAAIREMYRQKGSALHLSDENMASSGIIIRHLVLPGSIENSRKVLKFIAQEISPRLHISLMSQYYPTAGVSDHPLLKRGLYPEEYQNVIDEMEVLGLDYGWVQKMESAGEYRPDFERQHPFEL